MLSATERGQVSIEILLLAAVIIAMSIAVFMYYISIMDTTTALQVIKVAALKQVSESDELFTIERVEYKTSGTGNVIFCITTKPTSANLDLGAIETAVVDRTSFEAANISIELNTSSCD